MRAIVVKNVDLNSSLLKSKLEETKDKLGVDAEVSYGPFSVKGSYSKENESKNKDDSKSEVSIKIEEPSIIGYVCKAIPYFPAFTSRLISQAD